MQCHVTADGFPIGLTSQKAAIKVTDNDHMTVVHCDHCNCAVVAKHPNHDHCRHTVTSNYKSPQSAPLGLRAVAE